MKKSAIEITSYTDPYCTWCWGSEPILRKIQEVYGEQVYLRFVMGGLVEDMRQFSDPAAERKAVQRIEVQIQLAAELGLDIERFSTDIQNGKAKNLFQEDLQECRSRGVRGFPTGCD